MSDMRGQGPDDEAREAREPEARSQAPETDARDPKTKVQDPETEARELETEAPDSETEALDAATDAAGDRGRAGTGFPGIDLPLCGREQFDNMLAELAARHAPRRFAVVQEYGDRLDARVAAWGMGFDDRADMVSVEGRRWMTLGAAEHAPMFFARTPKISASVLWLDPAKEEEEE